MKLELHKLINQFWQLRRSKRITSLQADLYMFLVQECNVKYWENPFECSNVLIKASIGISEPSLIDARNRLKQIGLIEFQGGKRNENSPVYQLLYLNNFSRNRGESLVKSLVETEVNDVPIKRLKPNKNKTSKSHSGGEPPAAPKKIAEPFWEKLVETWFFFYGEKFKNEEGQPAKPAFNAAAADNLKKVIGHLKKMTQKEWTEGYAVHVLQKFFLKAYNHDQWMKDNFELGNLLSKFNSITNKSTDGVQNNRGSNNAASRADLVSAGQNTSAAILREQLEQLEP